MFIYIFFLYKYTYINTNFSHDFRFIQVIQSAGKPLKSGFYNLITHIEVFTLKYDFILLQIVIYDCII